MHTSLMAFVLVSIAIPVSNQSFSTPESPHVSEIIRITSPSSFICRLSNYKPAPSVRFRVSLRGIDAQNNDAASRKLLEERLKFAHHIELRNAIFKSYFRIEAELWLDGELFGGIPDVAGVEVKRQPKKSLVYQSAPSLSKQYGVFKPFIRPIRIVKSYPVSVNELLSREIDCSMLTDDMPLSEALNLLCESVQPRLPLLIRWDDLQANAFIQKDTPIGVEGFGRLKLGYALSHILQAVAGRQPKPALIAEGGILILGSNEMLQKHKDTRVYDVRDLLAVPSTGGVYNQNNLGGIVSNFAR